MACKELGTTGGGKVTGKKSVEAESAFDMCTGAFQGCSDGSCKERW